MYIFANDGPGRADVGTSPAVRAKVRVNPEPFFLRQNGFEGADLQTFAAVRAKIGYPVGHRKNSVQHSAFSIQLSAFSFQL
jgi:hypothetical protein